MGKPAIQPKPWTPARSPGRHGTGQQNVALEGLELLSIPGSGPDDVAILPDGDIVKGLADGRTCRLAPDGHRIEIMAGAAPADRWGSRSVTTASWWTATRPAGCSS